MSSICSSVRRLIGHTPLLELKRLAERQGVRARLLGKLEMVNGAGSVKDRVAWAMLDDAEAAGTLRPGGVVIEPTSGNTGIALAAAAAARGYSAVIVMPDTMSAERRAMVRAYGAELVLTDGAKGMPGAIERARELAAEARNSFLPDQFSNPSNPAAHYRTTGPEIWEDTGGAVDLFVAGVGTGGTLTGTGRYLREKNPAVEIVAVEPAGSPVLSGGEPGPHGIQGIGAGFVPEVLDVSLIDRVISVADTAAYAAARLLARQEGILAGISAGAALWAAVQVGREAQNAGKTVVVLLPDGGERYLSTPLFGK